MSFDPVSAELGAAGRIAARERHDQEARENQKCDAHPELNALPRPLRDDAGSDPSAENGSDDQKDQRLRIDRHDGREDERLRDRRKRVTNVERSGNTLIIDVSLRYTTSRPPTSTATIVTTNHIPRPKISAGATRPSTMTHTAATRPNTIAHNRFCAGVEMQAKNGCRRREGPDPERVEEVRHEPGRDTADGRSRSIALLRAARRRAHDQRDVEQCDDAQHDEQRDARFEDRGSTHQDSRVRA